MWVLAAVAACGGDDDGAGGGGDAGIARDSGGGGGDAGPGADAGPGETDAGPTPPACSIADGLAAGDYEREIDFDGRTRTYHLYVPESYDGTVAVPLVFDFHGYSSNAGQQRLLSGMTTKADEEGFVTVHGEGIGGLQSWNGGACCGDAASMDADDVGLVRAILEEVAADVCIDRRRVFATGMSNGGFLSHRLGCEASDIIAAIAPVAGVIGIPQDECTPGRPVPVMHFHGTNDTLVPYGGGGATGSPSVPDTIAGWRTRDGCTDTSTTTFDMGDSTCEAWSECDGGSEVILCTVENGGHWWPGGPGSTSNVDATDSMWDFFVRHPMP